LAITHHHMVHHHITHVDITHHHMVHCFSHLWTKTDGGLPHQAGLTLMSIHEIPHFGMMGHKEYINHKRAWNVKVTKIRVIHV
jgi:hypothetical protein